jgi:surface protein
MALTITGGVDIGTGITIISTGTTSFFPLSNTATDPTSVTWQVQNPGYTFTPNIGIATPAPMTYAGYMFYNNSTFNDPDVAGWDTSSITNLEGMFANTAVFNVNISTWNIANVTTMDATFYLASAFNGNISGWNTANVTNMNGLFYGTTFNGNISGWNTSNVTSFISAFFNATAFNCGQASGVAHDLMQRTGSTGWQVGNAATANSMVNMFYGAQSFNGNISNWCVSSISTTPVDFATSANVNFTVARQPTWGSCPYPNA